MERDQYREIAVGAGLIALVAAIASGRLPRWLRVLFVVGVIVLATGAGIYGYRLYSTPATLTVAAGSLDGDAARMMSAIATRMASVNAPVRLKVIEEKSMGDAAAAFAGGKVDLAIVRADTRNIPEARTVLLVTHATALLIALPASGVEDFDDLKGKTVGVVGLPVNQNLVAAIEKEYDLGRAKVQFKDVPIAELPQTVKGKQIQALLVVTPITEKYLGMLRSLWPRGAKFGLLEIEAAGAIAAINPAYDSFDLPKATLRGSPPIPEDDLTTLRVPLYLAANRKISDDTISALTKAVMDSRRELLGEYPILAQIASPGTDKDAFIPIHPGAAAYFDGDQKTFFDKYGDQFFYGSMLLGTLTSLLAAAWKFMTRDSEDPTAHPLYRLQRLAEQAGKAQTAEELDTVEHGIDEILSEELRKSADEEANGKEAATLSLMIRRVEHLVEQRRTALLARAQA